MGRQKSLVFLLIIMVIGCNAANTNSNDAAKIQTNQTAKSENLILKNINLPANFEVGVFASDLGKGFNLPGPNKGVRFMEFHKNTLFVSIPSAGSIIALPDNNDDGKADKNIKVIDGLNRPHGIAFLDDFMYVANEGSVIKVKLNDGLTADKPTIEHVTDLPEGGHWTRTIRIKDNELFVSIGSSCNVCIEGDERRASILKCGIDGGDCKIFAKGIRNAVGFVFHPESNEMYATENSRDMLGEDLPPDEINIVKEGKNYGWPICYGKNIHDDDFDKNTYIRNPCMEPFEEPSFIDLQAHSAPLGLAFNFGNNFPEEYKGDLFVAYHGSWNRKVPTGYKVVRIDMKTKQVHDFAAGWLTENNKVLGRPVDIIFDKEGIMYVSDDNAGMVYRIAYKK
ncbi:PQQ-dependent sugar dehydrogenase [Candidatus Woesearchaeota archaeon]|nr:PQQ-dependent sugar dehydrogenase [Candidatus Woesearchaeota archaeon]